MNQKKAKALRAEIYGHQGGNPELRRKLLVDRRYRARVKVRHRPTGELNPDGTPVLAEFRYITVYNDPPSARARYQRAKRAAR